MTQPTSHNRNALGDISLLHVSVLLRAAQAEGADTEQLAEQFQLNNPGLTSPEARISIPRFMRLGHAAIAASGNPALGLRIGALTRPVDAGMAGLAAETAGSIHQAMATLVRYALLTSHNSRGEPDMDASRRAVRFYSIRPYNAYNRFVVDSVLAGWTQLARHMTGQYDVLKTVRIEYPSVGLDEVFESWFRCPVEFGAAENAIEFRKHSWHQTPTQAHSGMHDTLRALCERESEQIRKGWRVTDRVKHLLTPLLQGQPPTLDVIANKLGTTPWTLQRKLTDEGSGFRALLDATRKQLALDYLKETDQSLAEIAWLLGFANPPAFHKAYRRWYGESPGEQRKRLKTRE